MAQSSSPSSALVALTISEPEGVRLITTCKVDIPLRVAALTESLGVSDGAEIRVLGDFVRGRLPSGTKLGEIACADDYDATEKHDFAQFVKYLFHGLNGQSAPKAALVELPVGPDAPPERKLFLLPPPHSSLQKLDLIVTGLPNEAPAAQQLAVAPTTEPRASAAAVPSAGKGVQPTPLSLPTAPAPAAVIPTIKFPQSTDGHGREIYPRQLVFDALKTPAARDALVGRVSTWITAGALSFPYKRHYTTPAQVEAMFARVAGMKPPGPGSLRLGPYSLSGYQPLMTDPHARALGGGGQPIPCTVDGGVRPAAGGAASPTLLPPAQASLAPPQVPLLLSTAPAYLPFDRELNEDGGHLVDYFAEPARMAARRRDQEAPSDLIWRAPKIARAVVEKALRKCGELTDLSLRRGTYGLVPGCNLFHANLASRLYSLFGGTRVLDPCAGWGDRLVGALANPAVTLYRGFDPNPLLVEPHTRIVETFGPRRGNGSDTSFLVQHVPFEDSDILGSLRGTPFEVDASAQQLLGQQQAPAPFDLVLTSPPYFDLEVYNEAPASSSCGAVAEAAPGGAGATVNVNGAASAAPSSAAPPASTGGLETQSIGRHGGSLADWLQRWYCPMLAKAWAALAPGGHMVIYINDHVPQPASSSPSAANGGAGGGSHEPLLICEPMLRFVGTELPSAVWVGCLGIEGETGNIRPLWVWRKGPPQLDVPLPPIYRIIAAAVPSDRDSSNPFFGGGSGGYSLGMPQPPGGGMPPPPGGFGSFPPPPGGAMPPPPGGALRPLLPPSGMPPPPAAQVAPASASTTSGTVGTNSSSTGAGAVPRKRPRSPSAEAEPAAITSSSSSGGPSGPADLEAVQAWLASAFRVIDTGDDAGRLRAVIARAPQQDGVASSSAAATASASSAVSDVINAQDASSKDHMTLLMRAAKRGRLQCARALLGEHRADVNAVAERSGYTALALAVYSHGGNTALIDALLSAGADPTILNKYGESAIRIAQSLDNDALAERLRQHARASGMGDSAPGALTHASSPPVTHALGPAQLAVTFRLVAAGDQAAVVALYRECQQGYMADPAHAAAHQAWLTGVLTTDLKDVAGHYASVPRAHFWVATVPLASSVIALSLPPVAAPAPVAAAGGSSNGGIPKKGALPSIPKKSAPAAAPAIHPGLAPYVDGSGSVVVIGCVAVVPAMSKDATSAGNGGGEDSDGGYDTDAALTSDPRTTRTCELQRMCVHPRLRRAGLASALLRHSEEWASASGYRTVRLSTLASMGPAMGLYRARGYAQTGPEGGEPVAYHGSVINLVSFEKGIKEEEAAAAPASAAAAAVSTDAGADDVLAWQDI